MFYFQSLKTEVVVCLVIFALVGYAIWAVRAHLQTRRKKEEAAFAEQRRQEQENRRCRAEAEIAAFPARLKSLFESCREATGSGRIDFDLVCRDFFLRAREQYADAKDAFENGDFARACSTMQIAHAFADRSIKDVEEIIQREAWGKMLDKA